MANTCKGTLPDAFIAGSKGIKSLPCPGEMQIALAIFYGQQRMQSSESDIEDAVACLAIDDPLGTQIDLFACGECIGDDNPVRRQAHAGVTLNVVDREKPIDPSRRIFVV